MSDTKNKISPNLLIVLASVALSFLFVIIAVNTYGIPSSFMLNLSASVITVAITVLLVDMLRSHHAKIQMLPARQTAIQQIRGAHSSLFLTLVVKTLRDRPEVFEEIVAAGNKQNDGNLNALNDVFDKYLSEMSKMESVDILKNFTDEELKIGLKRSFETLLQSLNSTDKKYSFAFPDVEYNTQYATLTTSLEGVISSYVAFDVDAATIRRIMINKDGSRDNTASGRTLLEIMVLAYLKNYAKFIKEYRNPTN